MVNDLSKLSWRLGSTPRLQKWPRKFEQAATWGICYLLKAPARLSRGAEDSKKNETEALNGIQGQGGAGGRWLETRH